MMTKKRKLLIKDIAKSPSHLSPSLTHEIKGGVLSFEPPSPIESEDISFGETLFDCANLLQKIMFMKEEETIVTSLWASATWFIDAFETVPYLLISSKTAACGKTRLLEFLEQVVRYPIKTGDTTPAAVFRMMSNYHPTLLMDESDQYLRNRDGFMQILNDGNKIGSRVIRTASNPKGGFSDSVKTYDCFGFKVIAGIKSTQLPDTITSRSLVIQLRKKPRSDENRVKLSHFKNEFLSIRRKLYTLSLKYINDIKALSDSGTIKFPMSFSDRQVEGHETMWAMLECMCDPDIQKKCKNACEQCLLQLDSSYEFGVLQDIYNFAVSSGKDWVLTTSLLSHLHRQNKWKDITSRRLGQILKNYHIKSRQISQENNRRGYMTFQLEEAYMQNR